MLISIYGGIFQTSEHYEIKVKEVKSIAFEYSVKSYRFQN